MFDKVLIANRGEIAVRICRTLADMAVPSVVVFADADRGSLHVEAAGEALPLGHGDVSSTYLDIDKLLDAVSRSGADAVHPGYGFLSESAAFAEALEARGVAFIGPRREHIRCFGLKHEARSLAAAAGVSLLPGSGVIADIGEARRWAREIGYPIMLKSSAGGGGIGMSRCDDARHLEQRYATVERLAGSQFGDARLFVERCVDAPRHVEVQAFGDGSGEVAVLGDRDCSLQRRHQKVIEECPAPNLPSAVRAGIHADATALLESVRYLSAGTVEFLYDRERETAYFLEVNTRLQVEHCVTEMVFGVDLVRWMITQAARELPPLDVLTAELAAHGSAIEARLCAEDPNRGFRPSPGLASVVDFPRRDGVRVDTWLRSGTEIPPHYDSLLAKVVAHGKSRDEARRKLDRTLAATTMHGVETNRNYLRQALAMPVFAAGIHDTGTLATIDYHPRSFEVLDAGPYTTVQAWPGRLGFWPVGVPPSGPMDELSFRFGNRLLGNREGSAGLEVTVAGPRLKFNSPATVCIAGYCAVVADGIEKRAWRPFEVAAGSVLEVGDVNNGMRAYLLIAGGLDVPEVMGSAATFTLGGIGGLNGRTLAAGDVLHFRQPRPGQTADRRASRPRRRRTMRRSRSVANAPDWRHRRLLRVTMGPHCTDEFLTADDIRAFLEAEWHVHYHSNRTGVRLLGPRPAWSRSDGGDAGLHPSNIHDNPYAFGAIDFTGDMPVILGPDGPSLGGFVCPAVVIRADRWKLGQLKAGDKVRLRSVTQAEARRATSAQDAAIATRSTSLPPVIAAARHHIERSVVLEFGDVRARRAGDESLLLEFGTNVLDLELRLRVHGAQTVIADAGVDGVVETTPGVRSLLVRFDAERYSPTGLAERLRALLEDAAAPTSVDSRIVHLPLSWDDPACRRAVERYMASVRADAPWCPDNIEFIRRINGLTNRQAVKDIVFAADYLVLGLGDVYLGAPVATPLDPRHRLVTTKYNPARTWTAENSVGIGGSYLCVYGMEGPGGYQFVGRTVQVWNRYRRGKAFEKHWLLRPFDRIRFFDVDAAELSAMREAFRHGTLDLDMETGVFDVTTHRDFLAANRASIDAFAARRKQAFAAELDDWRTRGLMTLAQTEAPAGDDAASTRNADEAAFVASPMAGSIWHVATKSGQRVETGDVLFVIESMKAEFEVTAPTAGVIGEVLVAKGDAVAAGQALANAARAYRR